MKETKAMLLVRLQQSIERNTQLSRQLAEKQIDPSIEREHLQARTEMIKALSWAMKTCSSIAWSDRSNWNRK